MSFLIICKVVSCFVTCDEFYHANAQIDYLQMYDQVTFPLLHYGASCARVQLFFVFVYQACAAKFSIIFKFLSKYCLPRSFFQGSYLIHGRKIFKNKMKNDTAVARKRNELHDTISIFYHRRCRGVSCYGRCVSHLHK
jgi:hypothetical protein